MSISSRFHRAGPCRSVFFAIFLAVAGVTPALGTTIVDVPGTGDLYAAGLSSGGCCAGDTIPADSPVLASLTLFTGQYLTFSTTGGAARAPSQPVAATADGDTTFVTDMPSDFGTGISGPKSVYLNGLAGVFLGPGNPSAAPAQLSGGTSFTSIAPGLGQIFFIGDGLTGTGSGPSQTFYVPTGATRLFLGVTDLGGNYDNHGTIEATITSSVPVDGGGPVVAGVPEPATWALMIGSLGGVMGFGRRRRGAVVRVA